LVGDSGGVVSSAPRISRALLRRLKSLSKQDASFAEINRLAGAAAEAMGEARPSYEQVRLIVRAYRLEAEQPGVASLMLDYATGVRSPKEVAFALATGERRPLPRRRNQHK
jgi:hypothetical protein